MAVDTTIQVLVVDDFEAMRRVIKNLLKQLDFQNVDEAQSGEQALTMLQGKDYGLVISDWDMDPMTGLDLLQEVRESNRWRHLPFIMVSAGNQEEKARIAGAAGASAFVAKPFSAEALKGKIVSVLGS